MTASLNCVVPGSSTLRRFTNYQYPLVNSLMSTLGEGCLLSAIENPKGHNTGWSTLNQKATYAPFIRGTVHRSTGTYQRGISLNESNHILAFTACKHV
jgi:hypothetical protein